MKKKLFLMLSVFMIVCLSSCSLGEEIMSKNSGGADSAKSSMSWMSGNDRSVANVRFEQILSACKNRDEVALKKMFSSNAINEAVDFDASIIALFDFFQGEVGSYDDWGGPGADEGKNDDGMDRNWKRLRSNYDIETSEQKYRFAIEEFIVDTAYPDNVGIRSLYIIKAEDSNLEFAYWGDGKWTPGIHIVE